MPRSRRPTPTSDVFPVRWVQPRGREGRAAVAMSRFLPLALTRAAEDGDLAGVAAGLDAGVDANARSVFQTCLLHIAARRGHHEMVLELLRRGAEVGALDYGGMRRTALHWACQHGHVKCVETLVAWGADTKAQGRSWAKLVQGQRCAGGACLAGGAARLSAGPVSFAWSRCGELLDSASPCEQSPSSLCKNNSVRLALERPAWSPQIHNQFPSRFRDAVQLLLMAAGRGDKVPDKTKASICNLSRDAMCVVIRHMAYPLSAWM
ncbi:unnamed protein product [Ostreobium quekettii]|uniref:Uncharacterized protein n=1 Tax=Ostreobium quekettii TaxID=121088 RepID=A0A8S1IQP4_9CHLO|nr:unnamed protein product [Ostreobium quekettii]